MSQEPLKLLPLEKWSDLEREFKADWPRGISGYTALETQRVLIENGYDYGFKVYCPFGDVRNGMVALNIKVCELFLYIKYNKINVRLVNNTITPIF